MLQSHLTLVEESSSLYSAAPLFKVPQLDAQNEHIINWLSISYSQFKLDVETFARHWTRVLRTKGIAPGSIIGLWIGGMGYSDILHIYGLSRAGFIPQLFSIRLPNPVVIIELLERAGAQALIHDPTFEDLLGDSPVPIFTACDEHAADGGDEILMPVLDARPDDLAFIFHTSGSTSGSPKLVPCNYRWMNGAVIKSYHTSKPKSCAGQDVTAWMGSMCHIGQTCMFLGTMQHGGCVIRPTKISFSSEELMSMICHAGLNRLNQFATFLAMHLRNSKTNSKLLAAMKGLDEVLYSGLPLAKEEEDWARQNGIQLRNLFGSTECGAMLLSVGGSGPASHLLQPLPHTSYAFMPADPASSSVHQVSTRMLELVILSSSPDCPDPSLRSKVDGHFHTGDFFNEAALGQYVFRGRDDDWIKSETSLRCDTRSIEDNISLTCSHLIRDCVVVGSGRPSPALFIEVDAESDEERGKIKKEIIRRTRKFHDRRYQHERITSTKFIVIVSPGVLPRTATKGNIRRKAVEEAFKAELDELYAASR